MYTAIILAAGEADRMGKLKQLLPWKDKTILETVIDNVLASEYIDDEIRVVLGAEAERVKEKIDYYKDERLRIKENPDYKEGMSSSLQTGIKYLSENTKNLIIIELTIILLILKQRNMHMLKNYLETVAFKS
mgnify:CR=1 FL=1